MAKTIDVKAIASNPLAKSNTAKVSAYDLYLDHTKVDRRLRLVVDRILKPNDLSLMHWLVLTAVSGAKNGLAMNQLANQLGVNLSQATVLVNQLKLGHLVIQKTDRRDRRQRLVILSAKGRALLRLINPKIDKQINELLKPIPANYWVFYRRVIKDLVALLA